MFCSNCGLTLNGNLNYCNSCGTRVERSAAAEPVRSSRGLALGAAAVIGVLGLGFLIPLLRILLESRLDQAGILFLLVAYMVALFSMFSVMLVFARKEGPEGRVRPGKTSDGYLAPASLRRADTAQLTEAHQHPASVTEHTTRTLEHLPIRKI
jgi:hypothetical protein